MLDPTEIPNPDPPPTPKPKYNVKEAPTSGITKTAEESSEAQKENAKLTQTEYDFVNLMHQHYFVNGSLPSEDLALELYALPIVNFQSLVSSPVVRAALLERGIESPVELPEGSTWRGMALTGEQLIVADTMLDLLDSRSYKKKLQDLGVSTRKWQAWLKDPIFVKYLDDNTQSVLKNGQHEAALALMDRVQAGDMKAWDRYMEYTQRFIPQSRTQQGTIENFDARQMIRDFVEIVIDEVEDHQLAARIADRIKGLIVREAVVNEAMTPRAVPTPEVVPNRVLTTAMEKTGMSL